MKFLWIGAHPDDELFIAPWLGSMVEQNHQCGFLIATRGERGDRIIEDPTARHLAEVRTEEMQNAAAIFNGQLFFADLPDGSAADPGDVLDQWTQAAGSRAALHDRFLKVITAFAPDRIVTFNPRHGCTWHADHRAVGALVQHLALDIPVTLAESRTTFGPPLRLIPGSDSATAFDARATWSYLLRVLQSHPSQISQQTIELFATAPEEEKRIFLTHRGPWARWHRWIDSMESASRHWPVVRNVRRLGGRLMASRR